MSTLSAEAPDIRRGIRPYWATTTTTTSRAEIPNVSVASDEVSDLRRNVIWFLVHDVSRRWHSLPTHFEGSFEEFGLLEEAVTTSSAPQHLMARAWRFLCIAHHRAVPQLLPLASEAQELLNWDVTIDPPPKRPSGTIAVAIKYTGRAVPRPVDDPWDE